MKKRERHIRGHSLRSPGRRHIAIDKGAADWGCSDLQADVAHQDSEQSQRVGWCVAETVSRAWMRPRGRLDADWQLGMGAELRARRYREKALGESLEEARTALQARDSMLAWVSHDLRDPLNTINLACSLLSEDIPADVEKAQLASIGRSIHRMQHLIGDLFDASLAKGGGLSITQCACPVGDLVHSVVESMALLAATRSIQLCVAPLPNALVSADPDRFQQLLANLISNAVRYTPVGGDITVTACHSGAAEICFSVQDTGAGIAAEHAPMVFDRFWQAAPTGRTSAGLGLAICKGIVEAHGGRIWVASGTGTGAKISFTIPVAGARPVESEK